MIIYVTETTALRGISMAEAEKVILTNMCMVYDGDMVLVQDRLNRLTGVEHITVSLVAFFRIASHSFLKDRKSVV